MLMVNQLIGFGAGGGGQTLMQILQAAGLTSGLQLCLDAGDVNSYSGTGQSWLDRSGNGYDFFRGATSGATSDDPTFNGTAGALSSGEYWSFDGGDYFTYDTTNETWMDSLHKDNALFSAMFVFQVASLASGQALMGTSEGGVGAAGVQLLINTDGTINFICPEERNETNANSISTGTWYIGCLTINEAGGAGAGLLRFNKTDYTFNASYVSPKATAADRTLQIGARGNNSLPMLSGSRIACVALWSGTVLTSANFQAIEAALGPRFGI